MVTGVGGLMEVDKLQELSAIELDKYIRIVGDSVQDLAQELLADRLPIIMLQKLVLEKAGRKDQVCCTFCGRHKPIVGWVAMKKACQECYDKGDES